MRLPREAKSAQIVDVEVQIADTRSSPVSRDLNTSFNIEECGVKSKDPKVIDFAAASESK